MNETRLDHLVVAAPDLENGREYVERLLGAETVPGGRHEAIGTHNRLLRLGEDQYLEIIAIDPDGAKPDRPRWFALDDPAMRERLRESPALVTWVARTTDIDRAAAMPPYSDLAVHDMARGDLRWRMTFTPDGGLLYEGALPMLIEWQTESTPPSRLPQVGCALSRFVIQSPHAHRVEQALQDAGIRNVDVEQADQTALAATISTPARGEVILSSAWVAS